MAVKAFPKRKGRFQLELWRRSWALPASDPSALVATRQSFEHSITDVLLRPWSRRARFKQYKRHRRTADILAETDAQNLEAFFSRPTTGILQLPTYAGANLRADRTLASTSKFSLPMQSHVQRAIFRALVTESRRALATRGRVGSAVWAAAVDEGYPTRGEVHKAGGGEFGGQSSVLFLSLPRPSRSSPRPPSSTTTTNPAGVHQPRRRRPMSWSTPSSPFAIRSVPLLLSRPRSHQRTPSGSAILVSRLYSLPYAQLLTRPFSVAFAP